MGNFQMRGEGFWGRWWAVVALIGLLPLIVAIVVLLVMIDRLQTDAISATLDRRAATAAAAVEQMLSSNVELLSSLAGSPALDRGEVEKFGTLAERVFAGHPDWQDLTLSDDQAPLLKLPRQAGAPLPGGNLRRLDGSLSAPQITAGRAGNPYEGIEIALPVIREGKAIYRLEASLKPAAVMQRLQLGGLPEQLTYLLVDGDDQVMAEISHADTIPGPAVAAVLQDQHRHRAANMAEIAAAGGSESYSATAAVKGTSWHVVVAAPVAVAAAPYASIRDFLRSGAIGLVVVAFFIVAEALIRGRRAIEAQQQELARNLRAVRDASRKKSALLNAMSHELRTPLTAILGFAEIMQQYDFGKQTLDRFRQYAGDIKVSGEHLLSLINDLLDLGRIEAGKMELHESEFDLVRTLHAVLPMLRQKAGAAGVALAFKPGSKPLWVRADPLKIRQCVINLVANAIKFTPRAGRVCLSLEGDANGVAIAVADTGVGIKASDLLTVFSEFGQIGNSMNPLHEGSGLGLPLARRLIELHEGSIAVESTVGQGSVFTMRLPANRVLGSMETADESNVIFLEGAGGVS